MLPNKPIHFVNGNQLCDAQYASYIEQDGVKRGFEAGRQVGRDEEQKRITKALRELHKQSWTLSDVIEAEDTMGQLSRE